MVKKADSIALKLGRKVRALRKQKGLSQEELAAKAGLGVKHIQFIESKTPHNSTILTLQKLAKGLDVKISDLMQIDD